MPVTPPLPAPLDGVLVVALKQAVAGPFATRHLADLGARVVKIERPQAGDFARSYDRTVGGESSYFVWLNRGKESLELDLKDPADRRVLDRIIAEADVFLHNLRPEAVQRLGLTANLLREGHPELIHVSISGYGLDGPQPDRKAYDALIQAETGLIAATGAPDAPARVGACDNTDRMTARGHLTALGLGTTRSP